MFSDNLENFETLQVFFTQTADTEEARAKLQSLIIDAQQNMNDADKADKSFVKIMEVLSNRVQEKEKIIIIDIFSDQKDKRLSLLKDMKDYGKIDDPMGAFQSPAVSRSSQNDIEF